MVLEIVDTTVIEVEWNVSKWGMLKPRIRIEPVKISGATVNYTSGFDAGFIERNGIGPGAIVSITRSGEVIPFIVKVIKKVKPQMPDIPYKWNETHVNIYTEDEGEIMCIKLISSFFGSLGIKHVSEATVQKLYSHGYDNIFKILGASKSDLEQIDTFQKRKAERTYTNIHAGLQDVSASKVLGASGVFGFGLGKRRVTALLEDIPDIFTLYKTLTKKEFLERVMKVEGFAEKSAKQVVENIPYAEAFYIGMQKYATFSDTSKSSDTLKGQQFVMSGFRDQQLENLITDHGGKMVSSISKKTSALIVKSREGKPTGKYKKAIDLGIPVYTKEEFEKNIIYT